MSFILDIIIPSWQEFLQGLVFIGCIYFGCLILHLIVPCYKLEEGYCIHYKTKKPLNYRLNGLRVLIISIIIALIFRNTILKFLFYNYIGNLQAANVIGLIISFLLYISGNQKLKIKDPQLQPYIRALTIDYNTRKNENPSQQDWQYLEKRSIFQAFYLGFDWNPRFLNDKFDFKMYLYLCGAVQLELNILSPLCETSNFTSSYILYALLFTLFISEYLFFEYIHIYTYDIFCERIGFKLTWGCFCFYPFIYCIGLWSTLTQLPFNNVNNTNQKDLNTTQIALTVLLYLFGYLFTRGANLQKYYCKKYPNTTIILGCIKQEFVPNSNNRLLCSGFWGLARHINYLGEILQAIALCLPGYFSSNQMLGFIYPLYYIGLFIPRAQQDGIICKEKYGEKLWTDYKKTVKFEIIPYLY